MKAIKTILEKLNNAYAAGDTATISSLVTDDIVWDMKGSDVIKGKKAFDEMNEGMKGMTAPDMKIEHVIVEGLLASANGTMKYTDQKGENKTMVFCDIYKFKDGDKLLISEMTSYMLHI